MASYFSELYSDFQDRVKEYKEKLDITELSFMRMLTKGVQKFQQKVKLVERNVLVPRNVLTDAFPLPNDFLQLIEAKDEEGYTLVSMSWTQFTRNVEKRSDANEYVETTHDYMMRLREYYSRNAKSNYPRHITIFARNFAVFPNPSLDDNISFRYYPDMPAISRNSADWTAWFVGGVFDNSVFVSAQLHRSLAPYEDAFVDYAIAEYLMSIGSINYKVYEQRFQEEVQRAIAEKPTLVKEMVRDYMFAPYS